MKILGICEDETNLEKLSQRVSARVEELTGDEKKSFGEEAIEVLKIMLPLYEKK